MRQDAFNLGTWGRIPVSLHWTALLSFAWLYIIFWDVVATLIGAVALLAWNTAQEQRAGRFDSLIARVTSAQSLALFRAVEIARWACIGVLAIAVVGLIRLVALGEI